MHSFVSSKYFPLSLRSAPRTYKTVERSIIYAAPVWSPNLHDTNYRKIKYTQNEALRIATDCHKMSSIDHLHTEAEMQNVCHSITTRATPKRQMKETLYTRHTTYFNIPRLNNTIFNNGHYTTNIPTEPHTITTTDIKTSMHYIHTSIVSRHLATRGNNNILRTPPPHIISSEETLSCLTRHTLAQLRTNKSPFLKSYLHKVDAKHIHHPYSPYVTLTHTTHIIWFQRLPPARGGTAQRKIFHLANWSQHIHPGPSSSRSRFFMESSLLYAATLTHFSTEPLTTGPDYDPLLLLLALAGDVHPNPGPSTYPCSVCFRNVTSQGTSYLCTRCSHWVHSRCSGLRNAADYRKANGWICTAYITPPQPHAPSPPPSPAHTPTMPDKTFNILQWNANGIGNKQTELSIFLEAHDIKVAAIQESKLTAQSRSPNIQNYTLVRQDRRQGPGGGLLIFIHNTVSFTRKPMSTTSKNDPHLEELTISIAMDNTELPTCTSPRPVPAMGVIHHKSTTC